MKIFKKICLGVGLAALFAVVFQLAPDGMVLADGPPNGPFSEGSSDWRQATYEANSNSLITVSFPNKVHADVQFKDSSPNDKTYNFVADTNGTGVCDGSITFSGGQSFNTKPDITATISGHFQNGASSTLHCDSIPGQDGQASQAIQITNNTTSGGKTPADTGPKAIAYKGDTYRQIDTGTYKTVYGASTDLSKCYGGSLIVLAEVDTKAKGSVTGTLVNITGPATSAEPISRHVQNWPARSNPTVSSQGSCNYKVTSSGQDSLLTVDSDGKATFKCFTTDGSSCVAAPAAKTDSPDPVGSCESNFNSAFAWIVCPAFGIADELAGDFNSFVQDQLCFKTTNDSSTSTGNSNYCKGNNNLASGVHNAWNIFKNLASALIVIALLIMVISQAIGGGPFDAYTVRKMLPKLVAAVIIMQISWFLLKWAIDLSNDAGAAIGNLIMAPFGGSSNLALDNLLNQNLGSHTHITNDVFSVFVLLAAGVGALALSIPGLAMMALYVVLALFTAFVVLIFRKLLIIFLVILAPIAFVAWVMPGMDKYWTMWRTNFTKLLLMFPMIMGLLAAGKIFAAITAGTSASILYPHPAIAHFLPIPYFGSVTNFVNFAIIVGAYFGPYFFLPQTFKWGGAAMGSIAKGVNQAVEKGAHPAKEYLNWRKGLSPWKQAREARKAEVTRRAKSSFYERLGSRGVMGSVRRARLGGVPAPTPGGLRRERDLRSSIVERATEAARQEDFKVESARLSERVSGMTESQRSAHIRGIISDPHATEAARHAALKQAISDRDFATIESYMNDAATSGDAGRIAEANRFRDLNAPDLSRLAPHILKGDIDATGLHQGVMRAADGTEQDLAQMHGSAVHSILSHLSQRAAAGDAAAANRLQKFLNTYAAATRNQDVKGTINAGGAEAIREFLDAGAAAAGAPMAYGAGRQAAATAYDPAQNHIDVQPDMAVRQALAPAAVPPGGTIDTLRNNILPGGTIR